MMYVGKEIDKEATTLDAECRIKLFRENFAFYKATFDSWCKYLISENAAVNGRIACISRKPMIGCISHKLNLDVNAMTKSDQSLSPVIEYVHEAMKSARSSKNAAMPRNLTDLRPFLPNDTRWSGKQEILERYGKFFTQLEKASMNYDSNIELNTALRFTLKVEKCSKMLQEINLITKVHQGSSCTPMRCAEYKEALLESIETDKDDRCSKLYGCKLKVNHIGTYNALERGVIKLQHAQEYQLTRAEKLLFVH